jgi:hypothetical protein|tara:strand:- start:625 stop:888 length:264 start_codon:yes stop_codon:yes gene_type:complete
MSKINNTSVYADNVAPTANTLLIGSVQGGGDTKNYPVSSLATYMSGNLGTLKLTGLSVYPNNTDALAGGLVAGDVYKTATGELRIVV